ncbi:MAG: RHS repeat-associated core domain-containing protein [Saccharofermentans sp.]|nr:RHS repeat-associated core domain-containing protein [Saccharofermentans sp.]
MRALTNETGTITDTLVFDAFGNETAKTGSTDNSYGFQGEEQDSTGLYYLRARYMDPSTGTFTSMDTYGGSLSDPMSLHKYLFANANPIIYCDPSGHMSSTFDETLAVVAIISILAVPLLYSVAMNNSKSTSSTNSFVNSKYYRDIYNLSDIKTFNDARIGLLLIAFTAISKNLSDSISSDVEWQSINNLSSSGGILKPNNKRKKDNYKKLDEDYIRKKTDMEPHDIKKEVLGEKSKDISKYDIYVNKADNQLYLIRKGGGAIKSTGYYIT